MRDRGREGTEIERGKRGERDRETESDQEERKTELTNRISSCNFRSYRMFFFLIMRTATLLQPRSAVLQYTVCSEPPSLESAAEEELADRLLAEWLRFGSPLVVE